MISAVKIIARSFNGSFLSPRALERKVTTPAQVDNLTGKPSSLCQQTKMAPCVLLSQSERKARPKDARDRASKLKSADLSA